MIPAASIAAILSEALPDPPEMIAPAWPMRRPGGAVCPAMNPTTGFFTLALMYCGRGLFGVTADFADHDDRFRIGSSLKSLMASSEGGADDGIAADADAGRLADPELRQLADGFIRQRARARDDADFALLVDMRGHDADLALAGRDDAGAVRSDQPRLLAFQKIPRVAPCRARECLP